MKTLKHIRSLQLVDSGDAGGVSVEELKTWAVSLFSHPRVCMKEREKGGGGEIPWCYKY